MSLCMNGHVSKVEKHIKVIYNKSSRWLLTKIRDLVNKKYKIVAKLKQMLEKLI